MFIRANSANSSLAKILHSALGILPWKGTYHCLQQMLFIFNWSSTSSYSSSL